MEIAVAAPTKVHRALLWRFVVGTGSGALTGLLIGGIGTRIAMLVLRLSSDAGLHGAQTDDGFEIGRISTETFFLLTVCGGLGAALGLAYVILRPALPARGRSLLVAAFVGLTMGADIVNPGSFDFSALDPKAFAVASFALVPGLTAFAMVKLTDRLLEVEPWSSKLLAIVLAVASLVLNVVLVAVAVAYLAVYVIQGRPRLVAPILRVGRIVVPVALAILSVAAGIELWRDASELM